MASRTLRDWIELRAAQTGASLSPRAEQYLDLLSSPSSSDDGTTRAQRRAQDAYDALLERRRAADERRQSSGLSSFAGVPEEYADDPDQARAYQQYVQANQARQAVQGSDSSSSTPLGILQFGLKALDAGRRGAFAGAAELNDFMEGMVDRLPDGVIEDTAGSAYNALATAIPGPVSIMRAGGGTEKDNASASVSDYLERYRAREGGGDGGGDLRRLKIDEDDNFAQRTGKYLAAFGADVAMDPLTYVGVGVVSQTGRKAGTEAAEHAGRRLVLRSENGLDVFGLAADDAAEIAVKGFGDEKFAFNEIAQRLKSANPDQLAQDLPGRLGDAMSALRETSPGAYQNLMVDAVGGVTRNGYFARGSTGLRESLGELSEKFGKQAAAQDDLFAQVPRVLQGGLQIRAPGAGRGMNAVGTTARRVGGGKLMQSNPFTGALLEWGHGARNVLRAGATRIGVPGGKKITALNGRAAGAYAKALQGLRDGSYDRNLYQWTEARTAESMAAAQTAAWISEPRAHAARILHDTIGASEVPNEEAYRALDMAWGYRGREEELASALAESGLSREAVELARPLATRLHDLVDTSYAQLQEVLGEERTLHFVNDYVPRILRDEVAGRSASSGRQGWSPFASRTGAYMTVEMDPDTGRLVQRFWSPQEANKAAKEAAAQVEEVGFEDFQGVFKESAVEAVGDYMDRIQFLVQQELTYDHLVRKGLIAETAAVADGVRPNMSPVDDGSRRAWQQKAMDAVQSVMEGLDASDPAVRQAAEQRVVDPDKVVQAERWIDPDLAVKVGKTDNGTNLYERDGLRFWHDRSSGKVAVEPVREDLAQRAGSRLRDIEVVESDEQLRTLTDLTHQELRDGPVDPALRDNVIGAKVKLRDDNGVYEISGVRKVDGQAEYKAGDRWVRPDEWYDPTVAADVEAMDADIMGTAYADDLARVVETMEPGEGVLPQSAIDAGVTVRQGSAKTQRGRLTKWLNRSETPTDLPDVYTARSTSDQWQGARPYELHAPDGKVLGGFNLRQRADGEWEAFAPYGVESDLVLDAIVRAGAALAEVPEQMAARFRARGWVARGPQPLADGRVLMRLDPQLMLGRRSGQDVIDREAAWAVGPSGPLGDELADTFTQRARQAIAGIDEALSIPVREGSYEEVARGVAEDIASTLSDHARRNGIELDSTDDAMQWLDGLGLDPSAFARGSRGELRKAKDLLEGALAQPDVKPVTERLADGASIPEQAQQFLDTIREIDEAMPPVFEYTGSRTRPVLEDRGPALFDSYDEAEQAVRELFPDVAMGRGAKERRRQIDQWARQAADDANLLTEAFNHDTLPPVGNGREEAIGQLVAAVGRHVDTDSDTIKRGMFPDHATVAEYKRQAVEATGGDWRVAANEPGIRDSMRKRFEETGAIGPGALLEDIANLQRVLERKAGNGFQQAFEPLYNYWKARVTAGGLRSVGFSVRNAYGGMFNGWLQGVGTSHFKAGARIMRALDRAEDLAWEELGDTASYAQFISRRNDLLASELEEQFGTEQAQHLAKVWQSFEAQNLDSATRTLDLNSSFGGSRTSAIGKGDLSRWGQGTSRKERDRLLDFAGQGTITGDKRRDMSKLGRAAQFRLENRVSQKIGADLAQTTERYLRLGTYLKGVQDWGLEDGGLAASQIVRATQFDYADLSPEEMTLRGTALVGMPFYCVPESHEILTREGWKHYDELTVGEDVLVLDPETQEQRWEPLLDVATFDYDYDLLSYERAGGHAIQFTPDHRWPVESAQGVRTVKRAYQMHKTDTVAFVGEPVKSDETILDDRHAAILGWLVTDGYARWRGNYFEAMVYQSPKKHLDEVIELLGTKPRKPHPDTGVACVPVAREDINALIEAGYRGKDDLPRLVGQLSTSAAESMWQAMFRAEGHVDNRTGQEGFTQKPGPVMDAWQALCYLTGRSFWFNVREDSGVGAGMVKRAGRTKLMDGVNQQHYKGTIWCPKTPTGTWFVRHGGAVLPTGNTWIRNNLPLQARMFVSDPGRFNAVMRGLEMAQNITGTDPDDRIGEDQLADGTVLPQWVEESFGWQTDLSGVLQRVGLGGMAQGDITFRPELPLMDLNRFVEVPREGERGDLWRYVDPDEAVNSLSPMGKVLMESVTGTSTFTKGNLVESEAPWWARAADVIFDDVVTTQDGRELVNAKLNNAVRQLEPDLANLDRFIGATDRDRERQATSLLSGLAGVPVATSSPRQIAAELRNREHREWDTFEEEAGPFQTSARRQILELLQAGKSPGEVRSLMESQGLLEAKP